MSALSITIVFRAFHVLYQTMHPVAVEGNNTWRAEVRDAQSSTISPIPKSAGGGDQFEEADVGFRRTMVALIITMTHRRLSFS